MGFDIRRSGRLEVLGMVEQVDQESDSGRDDETQHGQHAALVLLGRADPIHLFFESRNSSRLSIADQVLAEQSQVFLQAGQTVTRVLFKVLQLLKRGHE
jgi:hypothetical protein